jgi:molybdenum cofactor cytidylyltransferase
MFRSFAVVPSAGRSARMGAPKLLLPLGGRAIIDHVLAAWTASTVTRTVVVVRADDAELLARCRVFDVDVVTPTVAPPDMKSSIQHALAHIAAAFRPAENDAWLLAPADLPRLSAGVIDQVLAAYNPLAPLPTVPAHRSEGGHPTVLPWSLAREVQELPAAHGVNALLERRTVRMIEVDVPAILDDLDEPADYERLQADAERPAEETGAG